MDEETQENILLQKQRKERKDLQAELQKLKHGVPKGDKKKKKEVQIQVAQREAELDAKHEQELKELTAQVGEVTEGTANLALDTPGEPDTPSGEPDTQQAKPKKVSKAQKRREKKEAAEKAREADIANQEELNLHGARHLENQALKKILGERGLAVYSIPSDGNCLYTAVVDQLTRQSRCEDNMEELRRKTANFMRNHKDDYKPFLTKPETGDPFTEEDFEKYCNDTESTPAWGGELEITVLAKILGLPVEIVQANAPSYIIGDASDSVKTLILSYHHHIYSLGAHYNSVIPKPKDEDDEDNFS